MKLLVLVDQDGHFSALELKEREKIIQALQNFDGGDFWANEIERDEHPLSYQSTVDDFDDEAWEKLLDETSYRGMFEIVELNKVNCHIWKKKNEEA